MSDTIIDMPKVAQMLDSGWHIRMFKNAMGSYTVEATHARTGLVKAAQRKVIDATPADIRDAIADSFDGDNTIDTDDFTPEQALTRMAYKVFGEII
jgi:hypothetical protein